MKISWAFGAACLSIQDKHPWWIPLSMICNGFSFRTVHHTANWCANLVPPIFSTYGLVSKTLMKLGSSLIISSRSINGSPFAQMLNWFRWRGNTSIVKLFVPLTSLDPLTTFIAFPTNSIIPVLHFLVLCVYININISIPNMTTCWYFILVRANISMLYLWLRRVCHTVTLLGECPSTVRYWGFLLVQMRADGNYLALWAAIW